MDIESFRTELETRLNIEKEYIIQELSSMDHDQEKLELLGKFNEKYKALIKRMADEEGIDLDIPNNPESENLSNGQIILGKTMSIYDRLSDELYEEITTTE